MIDGQRARVLIFLRGNRDGRACARCVGTALGLRPNAAQRAMTLLEGSPGYHRAYGVCAACGKRRLTAAVAAGS